MPPAYSGQSLDARALGSSTGQYIIAGVIVLAAFAWSANAFAQTGPAADYKPDLSWGEFKGKTKPDIAPKDSDAFTFTKIHLVYDAKCDPKTGAFTPPTIQTQFFPESSWVDSSKKSDSLLAHEQGHLNLTETVARKMRALFEPVKKLCTCNMTRDQKKAYSEALAAAYKVAVALQNSLQGEHNKYDSETDHGRKPEQQTAWNAKIKEGLGTDTGPPPKPTAEKKCPPPSNTTPPTGGGSTVNPNPTPKPKHPVDCKKCAELKKKTDQLKEDKTSTEQQLSTQEQNVKDNVAKGITGPAADNAKRQVSELKQSLKEIDGELKQAEADAAACDGIGYCPMRSHEGSYVGIGGGLRSTVCNNWQTTRLESKRVDDRLGDDPDACFSSAFRISMYAGYRWTLWDRWMAGLEGDVGFANNTKTHAGIPGTAGSIVTGAGSQNDSVRVKETWDGSFRGRFGYYVLPDTALYATGGLALQSFEATMNCGGGTGSCGANALTPFSASKSTTLVGWTLGGGVESDWGPWLARFEYRYSDFGTETDTFGTRATIGVTADIKMRTHTMLLGIARTFGAQ